MNEQQPYCRYSIENIESDPIYIQQITRSKNNALNDKANGVTNPPKLVDDLIVEFYGSERNNNNDKFGRWLTNCTRAEIVTDGVTEKSTEHFYQRSKFQIAPDGPTLEWCRQHNKTFEDQLLINETYRSHLATLDPVNVARAGRTRDYPMRSDWEEVKYSVMWQALMLKFQIPEFRNKLLETGKRVLVERSPNDNIWAINNSGEGKNMLGIMLMAVRELL